MLDNHTNEYKKIHFNEEKPHPIIITKKDNNKLSVMYLAYAKGNISPNMETQGILLLRKDDIELICSKKITFAEYKAMGGKYILSDKLAELDIEAENFMLVPKIQLLFLNQLFKLEPQLMKKFVNF